MLGSIFNGDGVNVTEIMIAKGMVRYYNGEKKPDWTDEELDAISQTKWD